MAFYTNTFLIGIFIIALCSDFTQGAPPSKIVGGSRVSITNWPAIVSIQRSGTHHCGGTLISKCHVLTAAHCLAGFDQNVMEIYTGGDDQLKFRYSYKIKSFHIHPQYRGEQTSHHHDIGIITLEQCIVENAYQKVAEILPDNLVEGAQGVVAGWGKLSYHLRRPSQFLQYVRTIIISNVRCSYVYHYSVITPEQICTISGRGHGFCGGDSGGPLIVHNRLAGIVSLASGCGEGMPDIYTRVPPYLPWIRSVVRVGSNI